LLAGTNLIQKFYVSVVLKVCAGFVKGVAYTHRLGLVK